MERTKFGIIIDSMPSYVQRMYCMLMVMIGWVFFRANSLGGAFEYLGNMGTMGGHSMLISMGCSLNLFALMTGMVIALFGKDLFVYKKDNCNHVPTLLYVVNMCLLFIALSILYTNSRNPFIYFNF